MNTKFRISPNSLDSTQTSKYPANSVVQAENFGKLGGEISNLAEWHRVGARFRIKMNCTKEWKVGNEGESRVESGWKSGLRIDWRVYGLDGV